ncbi:MAG: S-methyl-5-thioribose-1-phosphate isomerase [Bacteroidales bacterium]
MKIGGKQYRSIWVDEADVSVIKAIDQVALPFELRISELRSVDDVYTAIKDMTVRGAPAIGVAAAYGMYLATLEMTPLETPRDYLRNAGSYLISCRPTAVNLAWAVREMLAGLDGIKDLATLQQKSLELANGIAEFEIGNCRSIGKHGVELIKKISREKNGETVNILTHCNAGWLACVDWGTVTAPVYMARDLGIPVHVWVDETRPRNQGARLTAFELGEEGIPNTLVTDNAGGHLMQHGLVDIVFSGSDRTTSTGDVANKIGTYLKALAARDNNIPFYAALPTSTIDMSIRDGLREIEIEERDPGEVTMVTGMAGDKTSAVRICKENTVVSNFGFDVTPARLVSGLITEKGVCAATENEIKRLFSEKI